METLIPIPEARKRKRIASPTIKPEIVARKRTRPAPVEIPEKTEPPISDPDIPQGRAMRADRAANHDRLVALVQRMMADRCVTFAEGETWAGPLTAKDWSLAAGLNVRTFRRLISDAPFIANVAGAGSKKGTALRLGTRGATKDRERPPETDAKIANILANIWRLHLQGRADYDNRGVSRRDYGMLCALARELPAGYQTKLFRHCLRDWVGFMLLVTYGVERAQHARVHRIDVWDPIYLDDHNLDTARVLDGVELSRPRQLKQPSLSVMRRFAHLIVDNYTAANGDLPARARSQCAPGAPGQE